MSTDGAAKALSELPLTLPVDRGGPHRCSGRAPPGLREGTVVHRVESEVVVEAGHEIDCFGGIAGDDEGFPVGSTVWPGEPDKRGLRIAWHA